jgi:CRP/FNR family transcriptional regulator, cyclic AMP receptor protein
MRTIKFNAGDTILSEGEAGDTAFLIIAGSVEVSIGEGAKAKSVATLDAGEVFGEMSLIEPGPRSATVKAVTDTECLVTTYDEFTASIQANPERAVEFMKTLVRRLRQMNERMARMNPGRRGLRDALRDWQKSFEGGYGEAIEQGDRERLSIMYLPMI